MPPEGVTTRSSIRWKYFWLGISNIVVAAGVVALVVGGRESSKSSRYSEMNVTEDQLDHGRAIDLIETIIGESIYHENAPEHKAFAFTWLITKDGDGLWWDDDFDSVPDWEVIQWYIIALLYFTTNGVSEWQNQVFFLSDRSECQWH